MAHALHEDTIFALATPTGRSGVAVLRVSGSESWRSLSRLVDKNPGDMRPRQTMVLRLRDPVSRETIDRAMVLAFKAPASFTGEDVVEYHLHGSQAVIRHLMQVLSTQDGHRLAQPGEFTRRAFENGKIDLTEAEAIADLIDAQTQAQKIQALAQMEGQLSRLYNGWAENLKRALAHLEADIEFPDEDLPEGISPQIMSDVGRISAEIAVHLSDHRGEILREGVRIAVIGAPNAGKSSLLNALAQRDVAIVSDLPGTTRDVIETVLDIGGYPVILWDTAGLRPGLLGGGESSGHAAIEGEGIRRAIAKAQEADLKILLFDGTLESADPETLALRDERSVLAVNKSDLRQQLELEGAVHISAKTGKGLDVFLKILSTKIQSLAGLQETPSLTRARHREALTACLEALQRAQAAKLPELAAEDLRLGIREIGRITGKIGVEDLLDVIFRDFCIGK